MKREKERENLLPQKKTQKEMGGKKRFFWRTAAHNDTSVLFT
jgi:hypothetical protein